MNTNSTVTESIRPATGEHTTKGTPHGVSAITPHIAVSRGMEALDFYRDVLGARILDVAEIGGIVAHAVLDFGNGQLTLSEAQPAYALVAPDPAGDDVTYSLALYLPDVDAAFERAVAAGARVREQPATFVSGDRFASVIDPFGVRWALMTRVEDLSFEESARRVAEWAAAQG
ncbi:VOC family protein [Jongsikchunia kroppenstedtii]|uniref:VOC family protein n=1 Tax=Jongsikchunia kroppenstedtii TaxID=1121721 RepID=UPI000382314D|nr:VOC family protein [Jongsikchunia kroppenstedtii]